MHSLPFSHHQMDEDPFSAITRLSRLCYFHLSQLEKQPMQARRLAKLAEPTRTELAEREVTSAIVYPTFFFSIFILIPVFLLLLVLLH
jgi:hypothetical protein